MLSCVSRRVATKARPQSCFSTDHALRLLIIGVAIVTSFATKGFCQVGWRERIAIEVDIHWVHGLVPYDGRMVKCADLVPVMDSNFFAERQAAMFALLAEFRSWMKMRTCGDQFGIILEIRKKLEPYRELSPETNERIKSILGSLSRDFLACYVVDQNLTPLDDGPWFDDPFDDFPPPGNTLPDYLP